MSTFGKKQLNNWNYEPIGDINDLNGLYLGFEKSPKDIQFKILEKWYPINEVCRIKNSANLAFIIDSYVEYDTHWKVLLKYNDKYTVEELSGPWYYKESLLKDKIKAPFDIIFDNETITKIRRDIILNILFS